MANFGPPININEAIAGDLAKIGIKLTVESEALSVWEANETGPATKRWSGMWVGGPSDPDVSGYDWFLGQANTLSGQLNTADYAPPSVDKLLNKGTATTNRPVRFSIYSALLKQLSSDVPYVPLIQSDFVAALSNKFTWQHFAYWDRDDNYALEIVPKSS